ncbi:MAG: beta-galactosidase trimerization domain-containing protein [Clostridia bacterium]|nr:beta-galactosidase trimerization domain-containing protein [Clostridia bacterium]
MKDTLRFRQIHLDFHTSELIENVGKEFNKEEFSSTLKEAGVDSISCFARCHHGMMYYDSKKFPERIHPNLVNKNLLKEQIEACHSAGIKVPVYITVQWDYYTSIHHPEWAMRDVTGAPMWQHSLKPGFYHGLCVNTPYREFLKAHTIEILEELEPDGIFYDIVLERACACEYCIKSMHEKGYNPLNEKDRLTHYREVLDDFKFEMTALINQYKPGISIFYNAGHISHATKSSVKAYSHLELESLPGGEWGYIHFPTTIRYARNLGLDCLGHTGKFHTSWGDFHSFRNKAALEYECFRMLALNSKCLIGDQLEPGGKLSKEVYELIGSVYRQVKEKQPWCENATPLTNIGVIAPDQFTHSNMDSMILEQVGVVRLLEQLSLQFDFIDSEMEFSRFELIILPDSIPVEGEFKEKLEQYIKQGGKVLATFESGMDSQKEKFTLKQLGVEVSNVTYDSYHQIVRGVFDLNNSYADYIIPQGPMGKGLHTTEYVMYTKGVEVAATTGETLCDTYRPFFNRTYQHFCSHRQTPSSGEKDYSAIVKGENTIYFSHPIFRLYALRAPKWVKTLLENAINELIGQPLIKHNGPSSVITTINRKEHFDVMHILWYIPEKKSEQLEILEDVFPYHNLDVELKTDRKVTSLTIVPNGIGLSFRQIDNIVYFTIPEILGHCMIEIK